MGRIGGMAVNDPLKMHGFPPVVGQGPRVLILGSFPSGESRRRREYYGHPRNQFWRIMHDLFGAGLNRDYAERTKVLMHHGISLWDSVKTCSRKTSADSRIRDAEYNDIEGFLKAHPGIRAIFFDGRTAASLFERARRGKPDLHVARIGLPSTSPAYAAMNYEDKLEKWKVIKQYLKPGDGS
ncbi:MAG: DNA-deoxyinosine glycosylase [Deltaproteobacteria bacterium]|nr:DNA-deoxyinosine glycosylase [Deltaproteobacteria bacterium]